MNQELNNHLSSSVCDEDTRKTKITFVNGVQCYDGWPFTGDAVWRRPPPKEPEVPIPLRLAPALRHSWKRRGERSRKTSKQLLYFMQSENGGPIKIGISGCIESRRDQFHTARHDDLVILAFLPGDPAVESDWHARFAGCRIRPDREWFHPTPDLLDAVKALAPSSRSATPP